MPPKVKYAIRIECIYDLLKNSFADGKGGLQEVQRKGKPERFAGQGL